MNRTRPATERSVIEQVRELMPRRALTLSECYAKAEQQAYRLLDLLGITAPHVTYDQLLNLPNIEVRPIAKYQLNHFAAGVSRFSQGRWLILVDKNDVHGRRRFTLGHEFKHVIDHSLDKIIYARLGYGDAQRQYTHIEAICQYFAACFLMPKTWVKNAWVNGIQDVYNLASLFQVSLTAMDVRLKALGFIDDEPCRPVRTYFRHNSPLLLSEQARPVSLAEQTAARWHRQTQAVVFLRARDLGPTGRDRAAEDRQLALQREHCQAAAADMGLTVIREYAEHSGTSALAARPVLQLMRDELLTFQDVRYVMVTSADRLARSRNDLNWLMLDLEAAGAELLIADQPYTRMSEPREPATGIGAAL